MNVYARTAAPPGVSRPIGELHPCLRDHRALSPRGGFQSRRRSLRQGVHTDEILSNRLYLNFCHKNSCGFSRQCMIRL
jgi:hypothetical protein